MIVRNNSQFLTKPQWYFTDTRLEDYMTTAIRKGGWDTERIGTLAEAFCIAGCDVNGEFGTSMISGYYSSQGSPSTDFQGQG